MSTPGGIEKIRELWAQLEEQAATAAREMDKTLEQIRADRGF